MKRRRQPKTIEAAYTEALQAVSHFSAATCFYSNQNKALTEKDREEIYSANLLTLLVDVARTYLAFGDPNRRYSPAELRVMFSMAIDHYQKELANSEPEETRH